MNDNLARIKLSRGDDGLFKYPLVPKIQAPPVEGYFSLPRLTIEHNTGKLLLNDNEVDVKRMSMVILLGAIRTRAMWAEYGSANGGIQCESKDYEFGIPTHLFPWEDSAFDNADENGRISCGSCTFKNWTKDPITGKTKAAPCGVEIIVPILIPKSASVVWTEEQPDYVVENFDVTVMTFKRSALKPMEKLIEDARVAKAPLYENTFALTINRSLGGGFTYSVPALTKNKQQIHVQSYPELARILQAVRVMATKPRPKAEATGTFFGVSPSEPEKPASGYSGAFFS